MALRINTNVAALNAHKNMTKNDNALSSSLEKLSSGLRINRAADDASGMAIADSLKSQALGLGQAIRNANDGISMVQTADGALEESINIVNTIKTKSIQAAQDGQTSDSRKAIQADITKLMDELDMIAKTTSFNGQKLLSGAFTDKKFQVGAFSGETIGISIGSSEAAKTGHLTTAKMSVDQAGGGEVRLSITSSIQDAQVDIQSVTLAYDNDSQHGMGALAAAINKVSDSTGVTAQADVSVESNSAVQAGSTGSDFSINGIAIGSVEVKTNDNDGSLVNAINQKSDQHGITASVDAAGVLSLNSNDGRAIQVAGDTGTTLTGSNLSTFGEINLFQIGANEIVISDEAEAVSLNTTAAIMTSGATATNTDSIIAKDSVLTTGTVLVAGTTVGFDLDTTDLTAAAGTTTTTMDTTLTAGSVIGSSSVIEEGTIVGGAIVMQDATVLTTTTDSLLKTNSTLISNSILAAGTTLTTRTATTVGWLDEGTTLAAAATLSGDATLLADMVMKGNSTIASGSTINQGSYVGANVETSNAATMTVGMTLKADSLLTSASVLRAGSTIGANYTVSASQTAIQDMSLKAGSTVGDASELANGSTIGGDTQILSDATLLGDMTIAAGTVLASNSTIETGTVLTDDIRVAGGDILAAGTVLTGDAITEGENFLNNSLTLKANSVIHSGSVLAGAATSSSGATATTSLGDVEKYTLADIDVTSQEGAQTAISIADSALRNLDKIRSDLGSAQNQLTSTIANISVTRVNIYAAESSIRDVDFAEEAATFSKMQILNQASSFAMSQANASAQGVLSLLQG